MGRPIKDLTGQTFGRLTVVSLLPTRDKHGKARYRCRCSCGGWAPCVLGNNLMKGSSTSCGCERKRKTSERRHTHGLTGQSGNTHYSRWQGIKTRTGNPNHAAYHNYGGRGIKIHKPWSDSFIEFKAWLDENLGPCPEGHTLDRINNNGNYEPGNLRWATRKQQRENQR